MTSTTNVSANPDSPDGLVIQLDHQDHSSDVTFGVRYSVSDAVALARLLITAAHRVDPAATERLIVDHP